MPSLSQTNMQTTVYNLRNGFRPNSIKIDRTTIWGNPFKVGKNCSTREEAIEKYREWIQTQPRLLSMLHYLKGYELGCWCKPLACHGDVIAELADGTTLYSV